jgi:hypothetical protein
MISQNGINHLVGMACVLTDEVVEAIGAEFKGDLTIVAATPTERGTCFNAANADGRICTALGLEAILKLRGVFKT